ncbi:MAG: alpha/beta hydrolase [Xanthobacteraceae bacterium]|nr:alpha/beta hydrolase [Xanthobacteraceae bacterium]
MFKKVVLALLAATALVAVAVFAAFQLSPWPSALVFRHLMDRGGVAAANALEKHVPPGVVARLNERYADDPDAVLDVFHPAAIERTDRALPTIVWVHGGGFISGSKDQIAGYLKILAAAGYTVVGVNYSLAPAATYPTPVRQANAALGFLKANAARLHIDASRLFLAGDFAGAQVSGQLANIVTAPDHAKALGIEPAIDRAALRGVILHCGLLDPRALSLDGRMGGFLRSVGWSYFGVRDFLNDPRMAQFSVARNVTAAFPPLFISVGNDDPLAPQSRLLAANAGKLGVSVDALFFPADYKPPLPHEYQFNLDIEAGKLALERTLAFLKERAH